GVLSSQPGDGKSVDTSWTLWTPVAHGGARGGPHGAGDTSYRSITTVRVYTRRADAFAGHAGEGLL
ncbi:MAG: hypothetical protein ACE10G_03280, partial [Gemmatimonadales bacterium]